MNFLIYNTGAKSVCYLVYVTNTSKIDDEDGLIDRHNKKYPFGISVFCFDRENYLKNKEIPRKGSNTS